MPLNQLASLSVPEPAMIVAQPFDPSQLGAIEKAIRASDLGLNPSNDGKVVRIPMPPLTEERRKELSRHVHKLSEEGRNAVRLVRRDANDVVQTAFLEPGAALDRLEYLLVITDYDGGLPSPDEQPINCDPEGDAGILPEGEQPCIVPTPKP